MRMTPLPAGTQGAARAAPTRTVTPRHANGWPSGPVAFFVGLFALALFGSNKALRTLEFLRRPSLHRQAARIGGHPAAHDSGTEFISWTNQSQHSKPTS
jgi:hypothetical protein